MPAYTDQLKNITTMIWKSGTIRNEQEKKVYMLLPEVALTVLSHEWIASIAWGNYQIHPLKAATRPQIGLRPTKEYSRHPKLD